MKPTDKRKLCVWVVEETCDEFLGKCHRLGWMFYSAHPTKAMASESARGRRGYHAEFKSAAPKIRVSKYVRAR